MFERYHQEEGIDLFQVIAYIISISIGLILAFLEGMQVYIIGYTLSISFGAFLIVIDILTAIQGNGNRKRDPAQQLSDFLGKGVKGNQPQMIVKFKDPGYSW